MPRPCPRAQPSLLDKAKAAATAATERVGHAVQGLKEAIPLMPEGQVGLGAGWGMGRNNGVKREGCRLAGMACVEWAAASVSRSAGVRSGTGDMLESVQDGTRMVQLALCGARRHWGRE